MLCKCSGKYIDIYFILKITFFGAIFFFVLNLYLLAIPVGDVIWFCTRSFARFCPRHISGTVTRRDSKLSVLLGPAV